MVGTMENWKFIIFGLNRQNGEEIRVTRIPEFWRNENLPTDSVKIQQLVEPL